jgi:hypothetical protein
MVKRKKSAMLQAQNPGALRQSRETLEYDRPPTARVRRRTRSWWQKSEVWFGIVTLVCVLGGLAYIGLRSGRNTGYPQDEYFVSGGGSGTTNGAQSQGYAAPQEKGNGADSFLAFARTQHARSEARAARPSRP